jgi:iron complex outermembrane receptor protein
MRYILFALFFTSVVFGQSFILTGHIVDDETKAALAKASIVLNNSKHGAIADSNGAFRIPYNSGVDTRVRITFVGFQQQELILSKTGDVDCIVRMLRSTMPAQSVVVTATLGNELLPMTTYNKLNKAEIAQNYTLQDVPQFLSSMPSAIWYSEGGSGVGYNYLTLRGFDQRRIAVMVNGVPQNDPEDHNVYWIDFPDILGNSELIQVQRGSGSGIYGYPAVGGAINIVTSNLTAKPEIHIGSQLGAYNTRKYSAMMNSGVIDNKYSLYAKVSQTLSTGYRNLGWENVNSYYLSAVRFDDALTSQINIYGGPFEDGLVYTGLPKFAVKDKTLRKLNYSYWEADNKSFTYYTERRPEEQERFTQPHFELLNEYKLGSNVTFNSALFLVLGQGYYDFDGTWGTYEYFRITPENGFSTVTDPANSYVSNALIRAQVNNKQFGWLPRVNIKLEDVEINAGAEFRFHRSKHWGNLSYGTDMPAGVTPGYRYYYYEGAKDMISGFVNGNFTLRENIHLLAELQVSYNKYRLYNEQYVGTDFSVPNLFANPKLALNYKFDDTKSSYVSLSYVSREPRLKDYYDAAESSGGATPQFEQKADGSYDYSKPLVKPEHMLDAEWGYIYNTDKVNVSLNAFFMLFKNEIVNNGQLDRFGNPMTGNVDKTLHRGIEISGTYKFLNDFTCNVNATYSKNSVLNGYAYITYYDTLKAKNELASIDLNGNRIGGFPEFLTNVSLSYTKYNLYVKVTGSYVGYFYSDNYDKNLAVYLSAYPGIRSTFGYSDNKNDAYFVANAFISYELPDFGIGSKLKVFAQVNNIFDRLYSQTAVGAEFFPAAERNALFGINMIF